MPQPRIIAGVFDTEENILEAAKAARAAGLAVQDAYTPFPVHGMDAALDLRPSPLGKYCFRFAAIGLLLAMSFQYWVSLFDWPMNIGGKSHHASPALLPVAFEVAVLFAALGAVASFLFIRRLSPVKTPALADLGGVDDRFVLALRLDRGGDAEVVRRFLKERGAIDIREAAAI